MADKCQANASIHALTTTQQAHDVEMTSHGRSAIDIFSLLYKLCLRICSSFVVRGPSRKPTFAILFITGETCTNSALPGFYFTDCVTLPFSLAFMALSVQGPKFVLFAIQTSIYQRKPL